MLNNGVRVLLAVAGLTVFAIALLGSARLGDAASSNVVVTANIVSATSLAASCPSSATTFGAVQPGVPAVTGTDCGFTFGSSNDTSTLRVVQADRQGRAMWTMSTGVLDMTWGDGDGTNDDGIRREAGQNGRISKVLRQKDRTFIAAGVINTTSALAVWKFDADGVPVAGFGSGGLAQLDLGAEEEGYSLAVDSVGRIYVAGYTGVWGSNTRAALVARFNPDGTLDTTTDSTPSTSFNTVGYVTEQLAPANNDYFRDVAVDSLDRAVVAGFTVGGTFGMYARRYTTQGQPDTSFNGTGKQTVGAAGQGLAVTVQSDDKVVLGGLDWSGAGGVSVYTARLNENGSLDTNVDADPTKHWNSTGIRIDNIGPGAQDDAIHEIRMMSDGRVAWTGYANTAGINDMAVGVFTSNGQPDATFNGSGSRIIPFAGGAGDSAQSLLVDPDNGGITITGASNGAIALARVTAAGELDLKFSGDGMHTLLAGGTAGYGRGIVLVEDGGLVIGGETTVAGTQRPTLLRFDGGNTIANYDDAANTDWTNGDMFAICLRTLASATTTWVPHASCPTGDATHWRPVTGTEEITASVATNTTTAVANFRFGMKTSTTLLPGAYMAPVEFVVVAP